MWVTCHTQFQNCSKPFYVYVHYRAKTEEAIYVGKGTLTKKGYASRAVLTAGRNEVWRRHVSKYGLPAVKIVAFYAKESDAFDLEKRLILKYGRRTNATGRLLNLTDGGEGLFGVKQSAKTVRKRVKKLVGQKRTPEQIETISKAHLGIRHSEETRQRMRETRQRLSTKVKVPKSTSGFVSQSAIQTRRPVLDLSTRKTYPSISHAARATGYDHKTIRYYADQNRLFAYLQKDP